MGATQMNLKEGSDAWILNKPFIKEREMGNKWVLGEMSGSKLSPFSLSELWNQ
jgi:hypothetical protein